MNHTIIAYENERHMHKISFSTIIKYCGSSPGKARNLGSGLAGSLAAGSSVCCIIEIRNLNHTIGMTAYLAFFIDVNESTKVQNPRRNSYAVNISSYAHTLALCIYILRMRVRVPRCPSRPSPVSRLFHAGCTSS